MRVEEDRRPAAAALREDGRMRILRFENLYVLHSASSQELRGRFRRSPHVRRIGRRDSGNAAQRDQIIQIRVALRIESRQCGERRDLDQMPAIVFLHSRFEIAKDSVFRGIGGRQPVHDECSNKRNVIHAPHCDGIVEALPKRR